VPPIKATPTERAAPRDELSCVTPSNVQTAVQAMRGESDAEADLFDRGLAGRLHRRPGGPLAVGGAGLARTLVRAGLVDEYGLFVNPVLVGGGTPFFPPLDARLDLELLETRTFASRVVYLRYAPRVAL
jgi:dihydrofolate reductase